MLQGIAHTPPTPATVSRRDENESTGRGMCVRDCAVQSKHQCRLAGETRHSIPSLLGIHTVHVCAALQGPWHVHCPCPGIGGQYDLVVPVSQRTLMASSSAAACSPAITTSSTAVPGGAPEAGASPRFSCSRNALPAGTIARALLNRLLWCHGFACKIRSQFSTYVHCERCPQTSPLGLRACQRQCPETGHPL
jgi:hypothetical protein